MKIEPLARTKRVVAWSAVLSLAMVGHATASGYQVAPGDIIEVVVQGFPELRQRVPIGMDGTIALTHVGATYVAGLTLDELNTRVQQALSASAFRRRALDGHDDAVVLQKDEITATVAEYRPIYVSGDVGKSGEQPFRSGLDVRQAIAIAGGVDSFRLRANNPMLTVDLTNEYQGLWMKFAREKARIWRLKAELEAPPAFDRGLFSGAPLSDKAITKIVNLESGILQEKQADDHREESFLKQSITKVGATIELVGKQQNDETEGTQADVQDLQTVLNLMSKGNVTNLRVNDARRALLLASTRKLQTAAELLRLSHQQDELTRQLTQLSERRRLSTLQELQTAEADCDETQVKLQGVEEKLRIAKLGGARSDGTDQPTVTVFRSINHIETRMMATDQTELQPGDVVQITLPQPRLAVGQDNS